MQIQINTDSNIEGHEDLADRVTAMVSKSLSRFDDRITRVEVHLSDENSASKRGDDDMRCMLEARLEGRPPVAVTHQGANMRAAIDGATAKLIRKLDSRVGRLRDRRV